MKLDIHEIGELITQNKDSYTAEEYMILSEEWFEDYEKYLIRNMPSNIKKYYQPIFVIRFLQISCMSVMSQDLLLKLFSLSNGLERLDLQQQL